MHFSKFQAVYFVVLFILSVVAVGFAVLCMRYNRLPEGLIIIGAVLSLVTIMFAVVLYENNSDKRIAAASAGNVLMECGCEYRDGEKDMVRGTLVLCEGGMFVDAQGVELEVLPYENITSFKAERTLLEVISGERIQEFVCKSAIKAKGISDILSDRMVS